jgi:hypothetical protein
MIDERNGMGGGFPHEMRCDAEEGSIDDESWEWSG